MFHFFILLISWPNNHDTDSAGFEEQSGRSVACLHCDDSDTMNE